MEYAFSYERGSINFHELEQQYLDAEHEYEVVNRRDYRLINDALDEQYKCYLKKQEISKIKKQTIKNIIGRAITSFLACGITFSSVYFLFKEPIMEYAIPTFLGVFLAQTTIPITDLLKDKTFKDRKKIIEKYEESLVNSENARNDYREDIKACLKKLNLIKEKLLEAKRSSNFMEQSLASDIDDLIDKIDFKVIDIEDESRETMSNAHLLMEY